MFLLFVQEPTNPLEEAIKLIDSFSYLSNYAIN